jgi:hypothetical protein
MSGIAITFPSSPVEGQTYLAQNGFTYIYDSQKNRWKRGGDFVRAPKVLSFAGVAVTTTGSGITTGPTGALIYNVPGFLIPSSDVGVDSYKAYRYSESYPNYTEIQVSISSAFSSIAYAATFTGTTHTIPAATLSGDTTYYLRARQFVGSDASSAGVGAISGYSANIVSFATTSTFIDTPVIVSIAGDTDFPVYQIGFAGTTLPATVTYTGSGVNELERVDWKVTGPRIPSSTGDTALAEVGVGTHSGATLANALVLAMPFSGATGVGITNDVNNAIRTASGASAGTTKTITANGGISTSSIAGLALTSHFYPSAAFFDGSNDYLSIPDNVDFEFGSSNFTIEAWLYMNTQSSGNKGCITKWSASTGNGSWALVISQNGTTPIFYIPGSSFNNVSGRAINLNTWSHIAIVRNGTTLNIYQDGLITASANIGTYSLNDLTDVVTLGNDAGLGGDRYYRGYIQDLKIYKGLAKYTENFTPPLPTYGTISYTTGTTNTGINTTAYFQSTGDVGIAETSSTAADALVLAMPMNKTFGFQDINVAIRGLTSGASAGTAKTVGLGTTSTANAPTHPRISATESKWYDGAGYFDGNDNLRVNYPSTEAPFTFPGDFTIEFWINPSVVPSSSTILDTRVSGNPVNWILAHSANKLYLLKWSNGEVGAYLTKDQPLNEWTHIAFARTGNTLNGFINGVLDVTVTSSGEYTASNTYYLCFGSDNRNIAHFNGYFQDFKIYKGFAKYTADFTPPQPICGFSTDISTQTGFTTTTATGALLSSVVGLGSTSTLAFSADQTYAGVTSITSSSGITTLPDPYAQNLVLALPLADITGAGGAFTNDRNTQIRSLSIVGGGSTKTVTNSGVTTSTISKWYGNSAYFDGGDRATLTYDNFFTNNATVEFWVNFANSNQYQGLFGGGVDLYGINLQWQESVNGKLNLFVGTGSGWGSGYTSATVLTSGRWYHIAYVKIGDRHFVYIDGALDGSINGVSASHTWSGSTFYIGNPMFTNRYLNGYLQDFRIYTTAKYTTNFTPPPPMFGDYVRSTPNKIIFTPASDYVLEAKNTSGSFASSYSATRQWGTKPEGGIYDPYAGNLVLAIPGGAVGGATSTFDVTGQIKFETPTATYVNAGIVTYSNSLGIGTYQNKTTTSVGIVMSTSPAKYYGRSFYLANAQSQQLTISNSSDFEFPGDFCIEMWYYPTVSTGDGSLFVMQSGSSYFAFNLDKGNNIFNLYLNASAGVTYTSSASLVTIGSWNHIAWCRNNGTLLLFVNGILVSTYSNSSTLGYSSPNFTRIGGGVAGGLNANFNDFRIYKGVAKYTSNFTPPNQIYLT